MRLILILAGVGLFGIWGWNKLKGAVFMEPAKEYTEKHSPARAQAKRLEEEQPKRTGSAMARSFSMSSDRKKPITQAPKVFRSVSLAYRPLPPDSWFQQLNTMGVEAIADPVTRSVLLSGDFHLVNAVADSLKRGDQVPGACAAQAFAVYVSKTAQKGFDLAAVLREAGGAKTTATLGNGAVTLDLGLDHVAVALDMLADGSTVDVVQRPHVRLLDGETATIEAIDQVPIPSTTVSQGVSQTSIEYQKVGLQLEIKPLFLGDGRVRLAVRQQNGVIGQTVEIDGNEVPLIQTQAVSSALEMAIGETVVFGGVRTFRRETVRGILRNIEEVNEGALYVVLSTYSEAPRARVASPLVEFPDQPWIPSPGIPRAPEPCEWIDGQLLPPLLQTPNWQQQEDDFIRRKLGPPHRR